MMITKRIKPGYDPQVTFMTDQWEDDNIYHNK